MDCSHRGPYDWGMNDTCSELSRYLKPYSSGNLTASAAADVLDSSGLDGDDAFEFMDSFSTRYSIDMSDYRRYFHHGEEGCLAEPLVANRFSKSGLLFGVRGLAFHSSRSLDSSSQPSEAPAETGGFANPDVSHSRA